MSSLRLNPLMAVQSLLAVGLGVFSNQVSSFLDLSPSWLMGLFLLFLVLSLLLQALTRTRTRVTREGTVPDASLGPPGSSKTSIAFPVGLIVGGLLALAAIHLDRRQDMAVFFTFVAYAYEISASIGVIILCVAYRWVIGTSGLSLFGVGGGLGVGMAIVTVVPEGHMPVFTIFAHTTIVSSVAFSLAVTRRRWAYAFAVPLMVALFALISAVRSRVGGIPWEEYYSFQADSHDFFAPGFHMVMYEVPFAAPPQLSVRFNGGGPPEARLRIVDQRDSSFSIDLESSEFPISVWFEARGTPVARAGK